MLTTPGWLTSTSTNGVGSTVLPSGGAGPVLPSAVTGGGQGQLSHPQGQFFDLSQVLMGGGASPLLHPCDHMLDEGLRGRTRSPMLTFPSRLTCALANRVSSSVLP